ncbi:hypothetical protein [Flavobacterium sp. JP2137]|uniref:hypothetical protein n=1 Tax=Flavobacterium sp. JP2137 TaxID=3414510 RepID=UPI003D2FCB06
MIFKNHKKYGDNYPFNSKNYPLSKELKNYSARKLGRAFFSDGNVKDLGMPIIYDSVQIFDHSNIGISNTPMYYKFYEIKLVIYTLDNYDDLLDKYPKADLDFDEICVFFCVQEQEVITKVKLGDSLQKYSRFKSVQDTASFSFTVPLKKIQEKTITTQSILDFLSVDQALFPSNLIQNYKTIALDEVYFLDQNDQILVQKFDPHLGLPVSPILYGEQLKIRVTGKQIPENTAVSIKLLAKTDRLLEGIEKLEWTVKFQDNIAETPYFIIPLYWFDEQILKYNYPQKTRQAIDFQPKAFTTTFKESPPIFSIEVRYDKTQKLFPKKQHLLIPNSYRRNYEEFIGRFQNKNATTYEDYYIALNPEIEKLVDNFIDYIYHFDDEVYKYLTYTTHRIDQTKHGQREYKNLVRRVETVASDLWKKALIPFAKNDLQHYDDRPLYWARLKMQSQLKRLPLFKEDIDFEKSQLIKGSKLDEIITLFEEKSRNYTNIDFGSTPLKKILITGFDPFYLNSIEQSADQNIEQSNPSGCVALYLEANGLQYSKIQTMLVPVRFTDFDNSQNPQRGQGTGIIEKYIQPWIKKVDMIITISQGNPNAYNLDVFSTVRRGALSDNMNFTRVNKSKCLAQSAPETLVSTIPDSLTKAPSKALFFGLYYLHARSYTATKENYPTHRIDEGPGGNFLSNEIFYRVAKLRNENNPTLETGHFHVPPLQIDNKKFSPKDTTDLINNVIQAFEASGL